MEDWFWLTQKLGIVASTRIAFVEENRFCKAEPNMWQIGFFQLWGCRSDSGLGKSWTKQALNCCREILPWKHTKHVIFEHTQPKDYNTLWIF